eukprot:TRINITY_DN15545_c0_g1_i2.p1 TRINITY_DN15545_c0_g1~~TRINITY_DN15545_c0_g1_i2.p1  ORF type:complete len:100 (-),score=13.37 TRINITY_DN15545_c0_g1_i2:66-365(-)
MYILVLFFQAEDGIRDAQESRGLGDVYKRQLDRRPGIGLESMSRSLPPLRSMHTVPAIETDKPMSRYVRSSSSLPVKQCTTSGGRCSNCLSMALSLIHI